MFRKLLALLLFFSVYSYAEIKDYLFVLNQPISTQLNLMGLDLQATETSDSLQDLSVSFLTQLNVNGVSKLMLHKKRKVLGGRTISDAAIYSSSENYNFDYIYRVFIEEEYVEGLIRAVQSLDSFVHIHFNIRCNSKFIDISTIRGQILSHCNC